ncbi:heterokaryon incompatibility protein-domain-containing protein [Rhexocercosporidium sp. MPI-PUGE-AT-0058]|nr:heterokaryon incompatibility protein-domain-containing protein [Rhexocercosporidium sp. MPI-PUGE-AT-0058]
MRLLQCDDNGNFSLTEFFKSAIPNYTILSHRWGTDEVTFKDLTDGTSKSKAGGYGKIQFCGEQAKRDSLKYFWVDTCCIDKSSSAELSEAINSMFRWYQKAARCYVYLSDVSTKKRKASDASAELQQIHEITGIPATALRQYTLSQFDVKERFSWAKCRQTTRGKDKAYSLFGIFDVQMPLLYSEGKDKAFQRLREAIDKPLKGSENDLLRHLPQAERYIFWLSGLAGTRKSTISRTVARRYNKQKRLKANFFFSKGGRDISHTGKFFTSLAIQLASAVPSLQTHICNAIRERSNIANLSLLDQWRELVIRPLKLVKSDKPSPPSSYLLIINALNKYNNNSHVRTILQLLAKARSLTTVRLRVFLTSRPEVPIRHGIRAIPQAEHQDFVLHNIQPMVINHNISLFLKYNLGIIGQEWTLGPKWPGEEVLEQLVVCASGLFIWAATTCRFIREGRRFARKRLDTILKGSSSAVTAPEKHLNEIYLTILKHSISSDYSDEEKEEARDILKHILGSTVVLLSPLSTSALRRLLQVSKEDVDSTFNDLHAILDNPNDPTRQLRLHHPSFRDFLLSKDRCGDFWVDKKEAHQQLATSCIQLMSQALKKDICDMRTPGTRASQVESSRLQECIPPGVQYACLY